MTIDLIRRALAELIGTAFLVAAVVGSGIAASRLSPHDVGLELLENSIVTGAVLAALIVALQPVSAAFNPIITVIERITGVISTRAAGVLIAAQFIGGLIGTIVANLMFNLGAVSVSSRSRVTSGSLLAEVIATAGLVIIIAGTQRAGRPDRIAWAVGAYILGAYWFTSSTSFANPAVTVARMLSNTFAGIAPSSAPAFIAMQLIGGALGLLAAMVLYPTTKRTLLAAESHA